MRLASKPIDRRADLTRESYHAEYLAPEIPVVLSGQAEDWPAMTRWQPAELIRRYGDYPIRAYHHPDGLYTAWLRQRVDSTLGAILENEDPRTWGVCDLLPQCPYLVEDVGIPAVIAPEWVADEATVWFQPYGNRTGLHYDGYNSVLTVIHGEKRVLLFTPEHHTKLYPCDVAGPTGFTRASWSQVDIFAPDYDAFPLLRDAEYSEVIVHAGETLSIPCNWWHAVENRGGPTIATSLFVVGQGKPVATFFRDRGMLARFAYELGLAGGGKS